MSHSTSNRTVFDLNVTDFYETFCRHSTHKNTRTVNFFLTSQSNILLDKKISKFIEKSAQRHVLTGIAQILVIVETPFCLI